MSDLAVATNQLRQGRLDAVLDFAPATGRAAALPGNFIAHIFSNGLQERSLEAEEKLRQMVDQYRLSWVRREAKTGASMPPPGRSLPGRENTATQKQMGAFLLGLIAPVLFVVMVAVGCFLSRSRLHRRRTRAGHLETLMSTAASRLSIVTAKYLFVTSVGGLAGILNLVTIALTMKPIFGPLIARTGENLGKHHPAFRFAGGAAGGRSAVRLYCGWNDVICGVRTDF